MNSAGMVWGSITIRYDPELMKSLKVEPFAAGNCTIVKTGVVGILWATVDQVRSEVNCQDNGSQL